MARLQVGADSAALYAIRVVHHVTDLRLLTYLADFTNGIDGTWCEAACCTDYAENFSLILFECVLYAFKVSS